MSRPFRVGDIVQFEDAMRKDRTRWSSSYSEEEAEGTFEIIKVGPDGIFIDHKSLVTGNIRTARFSRHYELVTPRPGLTFKDLIKK